MKRWIIAGAAVLLAGAAHAVAPVLQEVQFRAEEDAFFDGQSVRYLDGRQTELILIGPGQP